MKKLCCLILCVILCCAFCACGKKDNKKDSGIDLAYYAALGQMPEAEYTLGTDPQVVTEALTARMAQELAEHQADPNDTHGHDKDQFYFEVVEGEKNVLLDNGHICYYYNKANKDAGISYIVNYDDAYGLKLGTVISEVKEAFINAEFSEEPLTEENAFFADYVIDGTVLTTTLEGTTISFVFQENALYATAIYNDNWSN